jgi:hypothetical protein
MLSDACIISPSAFRAQFVSFYQKDKKKALFPMGQQPSQPSYSSVLKSTNPLQQNPMLDFQLETEGAIKSEYLLRYKCPLSPGWTEKSQKTSKEKAKLGCKFAFEKLGEGSEKFSCHELHAGENTPSVYYKLTRTDLVSDDEPFKGGLYSKYFALF